MEKSFKKYGVIIAFVCVAVVLCGMGTVQAAEEEFHQTFKLNPGESVSVQSINGEIEISTWNKDEVDVFAVKKSRYGRDELDEVEIIISRDNGLVIETEHLSKNPRVSVSYEIKIPENIEISLAKSTNGSIFIDGGIGDAEIRSTNGQIEIRDFDGIIEATTTNGRIEVKNSRGLKKAITTNGQIDIEILDMIDSDVEIRTTNGSIDLTFPGDVNADIELRTNNGRVRANDFKILVNEISKNRIIGQLGDGGNNLNVRTTNGSISLNKL